MRTIVTTLTLLILMWLAPLTAQTWQAVDTLIPTDSPKAVVAYIADYSGVWGVPGPVWNLPPNQWHTITPYVGLNIPNNAVGLTVHAHMITSGGTRLQSDPNPITYCGGHLTVRAYGSTLHENMYVAAMTVAAAPGEPIQRTDLPHGNGLYVIASGERQLATFTIPLGPGGQFQLYWKTSDTRCTTTIAIELDAIHIPKGATPGPTLQGIKHW